VQNLTIITPCSRPGNLLAVWQTIPKGSQWIVVLDRPNLDDAPPELVTEPDIQFHHVTGPGIEGNVQRNLGLAQPLREYVYFLDDDNIVHPMFASVLAAHAPTHKIIVVNQLNPDGSVRLKAGAPVRVGGIDTAQLILPREYAAQYRWTPHLRFADGFYFTSIYKNHTDQFLFVDIDAAYYNYLRPKTRVTP
jgi:hypothetical protein